MSQILPRHIFPFSFFKIHFNIILMPMLRSSKRTPSLMLFRKIPAWFASPFHSWHVSIRPTLLDTFSLTVLGEVHKLWCFPYSHSLQSPSVSLSLSFSVFAFACLNIGLIHTAYRTTLKLQWTIPSSVPVPMYQTVRRYIPEQKFILTAVRTSNITKGAHFMTNILVRSTDLRLSCSVLI